MLRNLRAVAGLSKAVRERGGNGTLLGRPRSLPLAKRVLMIAVYERTNNLTMRQLRPLFGVSSSTACRVIQKLGLSLTLEPVLRPTDAADRLWIVDGTLVPSVTGKRGYVCLGTVTAGALLIWPRS